MNKGSVTSETFKEVSGGGGTDLSEPYGLCKDFSSGFYSERKIILGEERNIMAIGLN